MDLFLHGYNFYVHRRKSGFRVAISDEKTRWSHSTINQTGNEMEI